MPELPEVQTVVLTLRPKVVGRAIRGVALARRDIVSPVTIDLVTQLTGRTIRNVARRGKRIVFTLDDGNRFYIHLGMTGQLTTARPDAEAPPHTHLELDVGPGRVLRFRDPRRFGGVWWLGSEDGAQDVGMGPEPLAMRPAQLAKRLGRTTRAVKNALMDQRVVAGLGNIYVDESLFAAGIHPLARADALTAEQVARLNRAIKATLRRALRHRGSTLRDYRDADGESGGFQKLHRVYDRAGKPCRRCRTPIERIVLGGRSTHFCPRCQPA
jgi:formamidopyrimidine-DNA glycosylase